MNKVYTRSNFSLLGMAPVLLALLILTGCSTVENQPPPAPVPASVTTEPVTKPVSQQDTSTLKASNTPLGIYDQKVIEQIRNRWYEFVASSATQRQKIGRVIVKFRLHSDGQISEVTTTESTTSTIQVAYCKLAIEKSAPFPPWPEEVREAIDKDYREVIFTFVYH